MYSAVGGGVGALYGPLHGGANEAVLRMLERIGSTDNIPAFIEGVKNRKEKLFGFGHRWAAAACAACCVWMMACARRSRVVLLHKGIFRIISSMLSAVEAHPHPQH